MTDWVRLWHDMPTDPKWRVIARKSGQPLPCVLAVFTIMLTNASANSEHRGLLLAWDHEDVGAALDIDAEAVEAIYDAMQGKVLDGNSLTGWERRQPKREDSGVSARVAKHRATKAAEVKRDVTQRNAPETETETETEINTTPAKADVVKRASKFAVLWPCPQSVNPDHWCDFLKNRKTKHLTNTQTALDQQIADLARVSAETGWPPGEVVRICAAKGWGSINNPMDGRNGKQPNSDGLGRTGRAMLAVENQLRQAGHH